MADFPFRLSHYYSTKVIGVTADLGYRTEEEKQGSNQSSVIVQRD